MDFVIANQEKVNAMIKTTLKIDGMMCGMCESHMNDLIRKNFQVKKVTSSAKDGETVIISDNEIDIPWAKKEISWQKNLVGIINLSLHEISLARQFLLDIFEGGRISTNSPLS